MERSRTQLIVMETGSLSFTAFSMASKPFTAGLEDNDSEEAHTDILNLTLAFGDPNYEDSCYFIDFHGEIILNDLDVDSLFLTYNEKLHIKFTLGGNTVTRCDIRKWGDFIWVPMYNKADTVYMVFFTDTPLSCLHSNLSMVIHSDKTDTNDGNKLQGL